MFSGKRVCTMNSNENISAFMGSNETRRIEGQKGEVVWLKKINFLSSERKSGPCV